MLLVFRKWAKPKTFTNSRKPFIHKLNEYIMKAENTKEANEILCIYRFLFEFSVANDSLVCS